MKKILSTIFIFVFIISLSSCYTSRPRHSGHIPPGKAKKIYGDKSAKRHAPGQRKKGKKAKGNGKGHHKHDVYIDFDR